MAHNACRAFGSSAGETGSSGVASSTERAADLRRGLVNRAKLLYAYRSASCHMRSEKSGGEMSTQALLIVHADVPNEVDRALFDQWYDRHMPDALRVFGALRAWRTWSRTDPSKHTAFYEFSSLEAANAAIQSAGNEFDTKWGGRASRTRDIVEVVQRLPD